MYCCAILYYLVIIIYVYCFIDTERTPVTDNSSDEDDDDDYGDDDYPVKTKWKRIRPLSSSDDDDDDNAIPNSHDESDCSETFPELKGKVLCQRANRKRNNKKECMTNAQNAIIVRSYRQTCTSIFSRNTKQKFQ